MNTLNDLSPIQKLKGVLSNRTNSLNGVLSNRTNSLSGILTVPLTIFVDIESKKYNGSYEIIPEVNDIVTLETKDKYLIDDITVFQVPRWETSNESGTTIYIGKDGINYG